MGYDYSKVRSLASKLIEKFGQTCSLSRNVMSGFDYDLAPTSTTTHNIIAVDLNIVKGFENAANASLKGETKRMLLIKAEDGFAPAKGDIVTISGIDCILGKCEPLQPGGLVLMYTAELDS